MPALLTSWTMDLHRLAPEAHNDAVARTGEALCERWAEPVRRYHTATHLVEMFWALEDLEASGLIDERQGSVARVAAWFHDAVYDPTAAPGQNEADSARLARASLQDLGVGAGDVAVIDRLIALTADHRGTGDDPLERAFHDADLWILSADEHRFDDYCAQVREEYAHVPDAAYRKGRTAILEPLLHRDSIYLSAPARREWEGRARVNVGRELARLR